MAQRFYRFARLIAPCLAAVWALLAATPCYSCSCNVDFKLGQKPLTERQHVVRQAQIKSPNRIIFEGHIERQALVGAAPDSSEDLTWLLFGPASRVVTASVLRMYKGPSLATITLYTGLGDGDCGFDFQTGGTYLIFADKEADGYYGTDMCTATESMKIAEPAMLRYLRHQPPAPEDSLEEFDYSEKYFPKWSASICGSLLDENGKPVAGVIVEASQVRNDPFPSHSLTAAKLSDAAGAFCIDGLSPHAYIVTAHRDNFPVAQRLAGYYPGVLDRSRAAHIEITQDEAVKLPAFTLHTEKLYTFQLRIVAPDGAPPPAGMWVALEGGQSQPDFFREDGLSYLINARLKEDGTLTFSFVPIGDYWLHCVFTESVGQKQFAAVTARWSPVVNKKIRIEGDTSITIPLMPKQ